MKILNWNIVSFNTFKEFQFLNKKIFDIICLQETKIINNFDLYNIDGYYNFWSFHNKYKKNGCCIYTKIKPISYILDDKEGRYIILEFNNFYLINVYVPNAGDKLQTLNYKKEWFQKFIELIPTDKELIFAGDFNVALTDFDVANPERKLLKPGFTEIEKTIFKEFLIKFKLNDVWRYKHPLKNGFTYFDRRRKENLKNNKGWRLDYFLVTDTFLTKIKTIELLFNFWPDCSDHLPQILILKK